jgi:hypothetical protein
MNQFNVRPLIITVLVGLMGWFFVGCANTVTLKESAGSEVTFSITFNGPMNFSNYQYYLIFGSTSFSVDTRTTGVYFFIPGETYNQVAVDQASTNGDLNYFYANYFKSWGGVLTLKASDVDITKGPFLATATESQHYDYISTLLSIDNYSVSGRTVSFTISVNDLNLDGAVLYYSLVTTSIGNDLNNTKDVMGSIESIELISNAPSKRGTNDVSLFPDSPAKIVSWEVSVQ